MKLEPISIEEAVQHLEEYQKGVKELQRYQNQYKTYPAIKTENEEFTSDFGLKLIKRLANDGKIHRKEVNGNSLYSLYSLAKYQLALKLLKKHFYTTPEALAELNYEEKYKPSYPYLLEKRFCSLHNDNYMNVVALDHRIDYNTIFIPKQEIVRFKQEYISLVHAAKEANVALGTFKGFWLNNYTKDVVKLYPRNAKYIYLTKKDWHLFLKEKRKVGYVAKEQVARTLGITPDNVEKVIKEYNLTIIKKENSPLTYLKKDDVTMLIDKQNKLWEQINNDYLTSREAAKILNISYNTISQKSIKNKIHSIYIPPLICINRDGIKFRNRQALLYLKNEVLSYKEERQREKNIENIINNSTSTIYNVLQTALQEAAMNFSDHGSETATYWFTYVNRKAAKMKANYMTEKKETRLLFNTTVLLIKMTQMKEIFSYTDNELNLAIFNPKVTLSSQTEIYKFLREISETRESAGLPINYKFNKLNNVYKKQKRTQNEKTIYSIEEYISLIDYTKNIAKQKKRAIEDIRLQTNKKAHLHRDSSWLYVLLHLNNAWRHYDIASFPRINLQKTQIGSMEATEALEWIMDNNLSDQDIITIINQVKAMSFIHSKTRKKRHFFCSQELMAALAHSLVLCELRCQICQPLSDTLIDFNNRKKMFKEILRKAFFKGFDDNFIFKSKQMNRTLISYIYSVIKKTTNRNPLEITKFIRSHSNKETTNIYIDIPQEQMDFITKQLFDLGHFGYAYDALSELILQEPIDNREERTQISLTLKKVFGDVHHIEQIARYLNRLNEEQQIVYKVIKGLSLEERKDIYNSIKLGQQPSKKEYFQCIYQTCKFPNRDCEKCQFAVPNFYALSQLEEELQLTVNEFKEQFSTTTKQGEKIRLSNILYNYLYLIESAVKKFGKDEVSAFFKNGLEEFKKDLRSIPSIKEYVTIQR
ncbi:MULTISPECIES: hypothetical protein [Bacillus cereus group]|uniref:hypothetical protein n=1 Tax=Bacillus cereus group TaxID=86661 RepID=UPI001F5B22F2|nr:hypothetical protein [Bacillus cereus]